MRVKSWDSLKQWVADHWGIVVDAAVRRLGEEVRSELEALRDMLNDDKVARKVVASALLLIQAERLGVNETALRYFGAVASGAIGGDGYVSAAMGEVVLTSGKRTVAQLWAAALVAHGIKAEVRKTGSDGNALNVVASGGGAARLARLYFLYGAPLLEGGDNMVKNHKLTEAVELGAGGLDIRWEGLRRTDKGLVAADLIISGDGAAVNYNVYLSKNTIELKFQSKDRGRVELVARLLRLAGVRAEVKKEGGRGRWYVEVATDMLAAGRVELRKALAELVREAVARGWVDADKAEGWLEKLERGRVLEEGWPMYLVRLSGGGALEVRFGSTDPNSIERETQRLRGLGLKEGVHFTVKKPEGGKAGHVYILKEGLKRAAWLSVYGSEDQRKLAAKFVEYILQRAKEAGDDVGEKAKEIVEEGKERCSQTLKGLEKEVEVDGKKYVVKVRDGEAVEEDRDGRKLLRIKITAEVDGVTREYKITYGRHRIDAAEGFAFASDNAPGGR
ncbi:MAG: PaRep2b protein [Pyrobaculum sp.]|nr:PaRep2b protein [Pyrobaculum sp.]